MKRKIMLCLLSLLLVTTVPFAAAAKTSEKEDKGPVGRPSVYEVPISTPRPNVTPLATPSPSPTPSPTLSPTAPNVGGIPSPTPTVPPATVNPTTTPAATATPSATPAPIIAPVSPSPEATPTPTEGALNIQCGGDNGAMQGFTIDISGYTQDGKQYSREFRSNEEGLISINLPTGSYTAGPKVATSANQGYDLPDEQKFSIAAGESIYLSFNFIANQRNLQLTVVDDDGTPMQNVTIGIFPVEEDEELAEEVPIKDTTDVSQEIESYNQAVADAEYQADPYNRSNAITTGKTDVDGMVLLEEVPVTDVVAVAIDVPDGYTMEQIPTAIPAGLDTDFEILCEYLKVDVEIVNDKTGLPLVDAEAVLRTSKGVELANWLTEGRPHRLIRIPAAEYELELSYEGQTETLHFEVTNDTTTQVVDLQTYLTGSVTPEEPEKDYAFLGLAIFASLVAIVSLGVLGYFGMKRWKENRMRSGGYQ